MRNYPNHCELSVRALNWINGELLGDGCLRAGTLYSAKFRYGSKYLEYIDYVSGMLNEFGIEQSGKIYKGAYDKVYKGSTGTYCYESRSYYELSPVQRAWYPEGKKVVPRILSLTPVTCRQWYIGDGCLVHAVSGTVYIMLCTDGFPAYDVEWLAQQLQEVGIFATRRARINEIYIHSCSVIDFLNYIGKCPVECYQYKWRC